MNASQRSEKWGGTHFARGCQLFCIKERQGELRSKRGCPGAQPEQLQYEGKGYGGTVALLRIQKPRTQGYAVFVLP
ncbi:MAG: hypothetical protein RLZZ76_304 [Candidatus Parcubacteria bacterium]|jgi:hypothetical protein